MKLPLLFNSGAGSQTENVGTSDVLIQNWYVRDHPTAKQRKVLEPFPLKSYSTTDLTPGSGTGCKGIISNFPEAVSVFGDTVYLGSTKNKVLFSTVPPIVDMASNVTDKVTTYPTLPNDSFVLIVPNQTNPEAYVCNTKFAFAAWALDGTTTYNESGTNTTATANKLTDSAATFTVGTATTAGSVELGMTVHNIDTDLWATITAVDSTTTLSLSADIFPVSGGTGVNYEIAASYNTSGVGVTSAGNPPFTQPRSCTYMDGYFIVDDQGSSNRGRFYISAQNDPTRWNSLDVGNAVRNPDKLSAIRAVGQELWLVGGESTEIWRNTGDADFPFAPIQGAVIQKGTKWAQTVQTINNKVLWLASSNVGGRSVVMNEGLGVKVVSTPEISRFLSSPADGEIVAAAPFAFTFTYQDMDFYALTYESNTGTNGPTEVRTLVYNITNDTWTSLNANEASSGEHFAGRALAKSNTYNDEYVCGDLHSNSFFTLGDTSSSSLYNDYFLATAGNIEYIYRTNVMHNDGAYIKYRAIQVDVNPSSMFPKVTHDYDLVGGKYKYDTDVILGTHYSLVVGQDKFVNLSNGSAAVTSASGGGGGFIYTDTDYFDTGDAYKVLNSSDVIKFPTGGIKLRYRDNGGAWSTWEERVPTDLDSRYIFRNLGRSANREFEIKIDESIDPIILGVYAIIEEEDREI